MKYKCKFSSMHLLLTLTDWGITVYNFDNTQVRGVVEIATHGVYFLTKPRSLFFYLFFLTSSTNINHTENVHNIKIILMPWIICILVEYLLINSGKAVTFFFICILWHKTDNKYLLNAWINSWPMNLYRIPKQSLVM